MLAAAPKLRHDLTVSRLETADGGFLIVKHPVSGRFYRFREAERFIAEQLDGETPLDVIRERTEEKFGASLGADTLKAFIQNLDKIGLLETGKPTAKPGRGQRIRGNLLYLRLALLDPDRMFNRLMPHLRFLFTRRFLVVSALPILVAFALTYANASEIAGDLPRLYQASAILPFVTLILIVASIHEFAHGLTCKYFGGEVHELGFMMMYFQPAFYCNVSDAWLFPEKSKRLWVGFAGPYLELVLWALATITWRLTEVDTWINYTALIVMTLSGLRSFVDFNPFVKLDGYYLLSDYLELPNLRRRSFKYVGDGIKRLLGFGRQLRAHISQRERRIYLLYGLVATVSSLSLLTFGVVRLGSYLIDNHQPMALLLLVTYTGLKSGRRFRRLFGQRSARSSDPDDDGDVMTAQSEGTAHETDSPEPTKKKARQSHRRAMRWGALAAAALAILFLVHLPLRIAGPFTVLPEENADVRVGVEGIVEEIRVKEGDQVKAGDVIARLADKDVRAELLKTEAQVREAKANLRKLQAGTTAESIAVARAAVSRAEDGTKFAQGKLARSKQLFERQALSPQEFEAAQEQGATADNDLAEARSKLRVYLRGNRPEDIEAAKAQLDRLEAEQHFLDTQLGLLDVVTPASGVVATPARELKEMQGQFVAKGALIAKVYAVKTVTGQMVITEKEIGDIRVGEEVALKSRAYPDMVFHGTVTTIATAAEGISSSASTEAGAAKAGASATSGVRTFVVTTQVENLAGLLKPGMTGLAKIVAGDRRVLDLITRRLGHTFKVEFWSWW